MDGPSEVVVSDTVGAHELGEKLSTEGIVTPFMIVAGSVPTSHSLRTIESV